MKYLNEKYRHIQDTTGLIGKDEPVFLLRAQDKIAPYAIDSWCDMVELSGNQELAEYVRGWAVKMRIWQDKNGCKLPD